MPEPKVAVLVSGGVDSAVLWQYAKRTVSDPVGIYYNMGSEAAVAEIAALSNDVLVRDIKWPLQFTGRVVDGNERPYYLPGRNMLLLTALAVQTVADEVWFGSLANEDAHFQYDRNAAFRAALSTALSTAMHRPVMVRAPWFELGYSKQDVMMWALRNGMTADDLRATSSCYWPEVVGDSVKFCGECLQCVKRWIMFNAYGVFDHITLYRSHPLRGRGLVLLESWISAAAAVRWSDDALLFGLFSPNDTTWARWLLRVIPQQSELSAALSDFVMSRGES